MLWYKAWAESRTRFLLASLVMVLACAFVLGWQDADRVLFRGFPRTLFMIFAFVFGMGGVLRERDLGTAAFTLSLPISRLRLTLVRAATGLGELMVLSLVPAAVIVGAWGVHGQSYPLGQAMTFAWRWVVGGSALFALAFLASATLAGEYTAFVAAFTIFFGQTVTTQFIRLAKPVTAPYLFTVQEIMSGTRPSTPVVTTILIAVTSGLIAAAATWTDRTDF